MKHIDNRLPAEAFCYLGQSLFGEEDWQPKFAQELNTDESTVRRWALEGPPVELAKRFRILRAIIANKSKRP